MADLRLSANEARRSLGTSNHSLDSSALRISLAAVSEWVGIPNDNGATVTSTPLEGVLIIHTINLDFTRRTTLPTCHSLFVVAALQVKISTFQRLVTVGVCVEDRRNTPRT